MYCTPGPDNSNLINTENAVPIKPENKANIKYIVPISLALQDKNHLSTHSDIIDVFTFNIDFIKKKSFINILMYISLLITYVIFIVHSLPLYVL